MQNLSSVLVFRCDGQQLQQHHNLFLSFPILSIKSRSLLAMCVCVCRNGSEYKNRMIRASTCGALLCGGKMHTKYVQIVALCCGVAGRVRVPWTNSLLLLEFTNVQIHFLARSVRRFHLSMFADSDGIFFFAVVAQSARSVVGFMSRFLFSLCVCGRRRRFAGDYI